MDTPYAIEMLHITKRFPGIVANDDITLQLRKGEIHALLGENGAGKSTLMSVLFGLYQAEEGIIKKDGVEVSREVVDQIITEKAVDEIIRVGTKIRYQTNFKGETRRWKEAPKDGVNGWKSMKVDKITAYCTGTRTATGTTPKLGTIAVNTYYFKYGTQLYVRGYGYGTARDTGAFRKYTNSSGKPMNQLDLWFNSESEARRWGTKYNVTIWYK